MHMLLPLFLLLHQTARFLATALAGSQTAEPVVDHLPDLLGIHCPSHIAVRRGTGKALVGAGQHLTEPPCS